MLVACAPLVSFGMPSASLGPTENNIFFNMPWSDPEAGTLFKSTASTTKAPLSYLSAPATDSISNFIDNPFETWLSTFLLVICIVALGSCAIFLAVRYAQVLKLKEDSYDVAPFTLEGQKGKILDNVGLDEMYLDDEGPVTPSSHDDSSDLRRRPRARYVQPKRVAIGGVRQGKIAQRRTSKSRSELRDIQAQSRSLTSTDETPDGLSQLLS